MKRKIIKCGEPVDVSFTQEERTLILEYTLAGPDLTHRLRIASTRQKKLVVKFTLDDLDELLGYIAAEANHSEDPKLQKRLDSLHDRLKTKMESYDDGEWQQAF